MKHNLSLWIRLLVSVFALICVTQRSYALDDGDPLPGNGKDPILWEEEQAEIIVEENLGLAVNVDDLNQFDEDLATEDRKSIDKTPIDQYLTETCEKIRANREQFPAKTLSKATQYFTPMFEPGANGRLQKKDRRSCINIEGSCIVKDFLYNWSSKSEPWGKMYTRREIPFKFGKGSGQSYYNKTNALDPCRTLAADPKVYSMGTVIYFPSMRNKICPQSGKVVDGCFIVSDVGSAIKGPGRFDVFTGECANYNSSNSTCADASNSSFIPSAGSTFYVVGRHSILAKELREEADLFINSNWSTDTFPFPKRASASPLK